MEVKFSTDCRNELSTFIGNNFQHISLCEFPNSFIIRIFGNNNFDKGNKILLNYLKNECGCKIQSYDGKVFAVTFPEDKDRETIAKMVNEYVYCGEISKAGKIVNVINKHSDAVLVLLHGHNPEGYKYHEKVSKQLTTLPYSSCLYYRSNAKSEDYNLEHEYEIFKEEYSKYFDSTPIFIGHSYGGVVARYFAKYSNTISISLDGSDMRTYIPYLYGKPIKSIEYLPNKVIINGKKFKSDKEYKLLYEIDNIRPNQHLIIDYVAGDEKIVKIDSFYKNLYEYSYKEYCHVNHMYEDRFKVIKPVIEQFIYREHTKLLRSNDFGIIQPINIYSNKSQQDDFYLYWEVPECQPKLTDWNIKVLFDKIRIETSGDLETNPNRFHYQRLIDIITEKLEFEGIIKPFSNDSCPYFSGIRILTLCDDKKRSIAIIKAIKEVIEF